MCVWADADAYAQAKSAVSRCWRRVPGACCLLLGQKHAPCNCTGHACACRAARTSEAGSITLVGVPSLERLPSLDMRGPDALLGGMSPTALRLGGMSPPPRCGGMSPPGGAGGAIARDQYALCGASSLGGVSPVKGSSPTGEARAEAWVQV